MKQRVTVIGVKKFKGSVEGQHYDNCKVRILMPVDESGPNERGLNIQEMPYGTSANFDQLASMNFPFDADVTVAWVLRNGRQIMILSKIEPVQVQAKG